MQQFPSEKNKVSSQHIYNQTRTACIVISADIICRLWKNLAASLFALSVIKRSCFSTNVELY